MRRAAPPALLAIGGFAVVSALGPRDLPAAKPFESLLVGNLAVAAAAPSANAFGRSGDVRMRFALPGQEVEYPLQLSGDPSRVRYGWVRRSDTTVVGALRPLDGAELTVPGTPGFFRLALLADGEPTRLVDGLTVAVLRPFAQGRIGEYSIGSYASRRTPASERPVGFLEIRPEDLDLELTSHLRVGDFLTHDGQRVWPRYAAVDPDLLDKLELVFDEVSQRADRDRERMALDVRSGFRTPEHNRRVRFAARDSRHQYGDAADVAMDADGDGRITGRDARLVETAVEIVERRHPELAGGLGVYVRRGKYVHIDTRGVRVRWGG